VEIWQSPSRLQLLTCGKDKLPQTTAKTRQLKDKLKVKDGELFQLLNGGDIVRRDGFFVDTSSDVDSSSDT
jgi:hypothetical protein